jgi:hypothetical protein
VRRAAIALLILGAALAACGQEAAPASTAGVGSRQPVDLAGLDKTQGGDGTCFSAYRVSAGGQDAQGKQVYVLTFDLKDSPSDQAQLLKTLSSAACAKAMSMTTASVTSKLGLKSAGSLVVSYRTPAGARLIVP